ncbi:hypothetical protein J7481_24825 [Labrenzia sp. R4_2]|uniref:calcium-binding protein n=1 Tax=Labrenzia sp. R4_2 TaxID=2821107 RepID=UPI001ADD0050|nr:calcium-binding protein [Labrenzia sp. R4_2]MBO9422753.1 hypothetical protein [Labrenzia sp. R4_2]
MGNFTGTDNSDRFANTAENDSFDGGSGFDRLYYREISRDDFVNTGPVATPTVGISVDFNAGTVTDTNGQSDTFTNIEVIFGTQFADSFVTGNGSNTSDNNIVGYEGNDTIDLSNMTSFDFFTNLEYGSEDGTNGIVVNLPNGTITDTYGDTDTIILPTTLTDTDFGITGTSQADTFVGHDGQTLFYGSDGADSYDGGGGFDSLSFREEVRNNGGTNGVVVNLAQGTAVDSFGNSETVVNIESVRGTSFADNFTGDDSSEQFAGLAGNDVIDGGSGNDEVRYDRDARDGGTAGVTVNLTTGVATDGFGDTDTLNNIERVRGTNSNDIITGNASDNRLRGKDGDDQLNGEGGNDQFQELTGSDTINGGTGVDTASFSGNRADFTVTFTSANTATVTNGSNTTSLTDVELLSFNDETVDFRNGITSTQSELYRFFNTETGAHFFTASTEERDNVVDNLSQFQFEGNAFGSNATADNGGTAVYRFFNTQTGTHFYTASEEERQNVLTNLPQFNDEGIAYYAYSASNGSNIELFRFFNTETGTHFYTTSAAERDNIINTLGQYNFEGVAYYVDIA